MTTVGNNRHPVRGSGRKKIVKSEKESAVGWLRDTGLQVKPAPTSWSGFAVCHFAVSVPFPPLHHSSTPLCAGLPTCPDRRSPRSPPSSLCVLCVSVVNPSCFHPTSGSLRACDSGGAERPRGHQHNRQRVESCRLMAPTERALQGSSGLFRAIQGSEDKKMKNPIQNIARGCLWGATTEPALSPSNVSWPRRFPVDGSASVPACGRCRLECADLSALCRFRSTLSPPSLQYSVVRRSPDRAHAPTEGLHHPPQQSVLLRYIHVAATLYPGLPKKTMLILSYCRGMTIKIKIPPTPPPTGQAPGRPRPPARVSCTELLLLPPFPSQYSITPVPHSAHSITPVLRCAPVSRPRTCPDRRSPSFHYSITPVLHSAHSITPCPLNPEP